MKIWTSTDFTGLWSVGTAAVVVAPDEATARELMNEACRKADLSGFDGTLTLLPTEVPGAVVLRNGDY